MLFNNFNFQISNRRFAFSKQPKTKDPFGNTKRKRLCACASIFNVIKIVAYPTTFPINKASGSTTISGRFSLGLGASRSYIMSMVFKNHFRPKARLVYQTIYIYKKHETEPLMRMRIYFQRY